MIRDRFVVLSLALLLLACAGAPVRAREACTLVYDPGGKAMLYESGAECEMPFSPASTFKLTLALIGFDSGLLQGPSRPVVPYDPALQARYASWRKATTPRSWLKHSVVWYSQRLTSQLGMDRFQDYVDRLDYGNRDLSGAPGANNGLTHAWLGTSLKLTPRQQAMYLGRIVTRDLPLSSSAFDLLDQSIERFETSDAQLAVVGKTGTAWATDGQGERTGEQYGWFVGWTRDARDPIVFVRINVETDPKKGAASSRTKAEILRTLPTLLEGLR